MQAQNGAINSGLNFAGSSLQIGANYYGQLEAAAATKDHYATIESLAQNRAK